MAHQSRIKRPSYPHIGATIRDDPPGVRVKPSPEWNTTPDMHTGITWNISGISAETLSGIIPVMPLPVGKPSPVELHNYADAPPRQVAHTAHPTNASPPATSPPSAHLSIVASSSRW